MHHGTQPFVLRFVAGLMVGEGARGGGRGCVCAPRQPVFRTTSLLASLFVTKAHGHTRPTRVAPSFGVWTAEIRLLAPEHPGADFSLCPHVAGGLGALWVSREGTDPIHGGSTVMTSSPPKGSSPGTVTPGVRIPRWEFGGHTPSNHSGRVITSVLVTVPTTQGPSFPGLRGLHGSLPSLCPSAHSVFVRPALISERRSLRNLSSRQLLEVLFLVGVREAGIRGAICSEGQWGGDVSWPVTESWALSGASEVPVRHRIKRLSWPRDWSSGEGEWPKLGSHQHTGYLGGGNRAGQDGEGLSMYPIVCSANPVPVIIHHF